MAPGIVKNSFALMLASGCFILSAPLLAQTPAPTALSSKPGVPATPSVSFKPSAGKKEPGPSIFRKPTVKKSHAPVLEPLGLSYNPDFSGSLMDYGKLNADLYPILSDRPHTPTADEKFWGTVVGAANYSMAGVAAAQALGILPGGRTEKKK